MKVFIPLLILTLFHNTILTQQISDIDGNLYETVNIYGQTWLKQNLRTTRFNDGTPISNIADSIHWLNAKAPAYCWYNNDSVSYANPYGALYNWYCVNTDKLCPVGWHAASKDEWMQLIDTLGGANEAMYKMRYNNDPYWIDDKYNATNSSGFTAAGAGLRLYQHFPPAFAFVGMMGHADWWTSTKYDDTHSKSIDTDSGPIYDDNANIKSGLSVRCIKND